MKKIITLSLLIAFAFSFAQHQVSNNIQELEKKQTFFKPILILNTVKKNDFYELNRIVDNATIATIKTNEVNDIVINKYKNIELTIPYNGDVVVVDLYRVNLFAEGFHVDTDKQKNNFYNKGVYYRGIVKGDYNSVVSFNFFKNALNGIISSNNLANLVVGKLEKKENTQDYIVYSDANLKVLSEINCNFNDKTIKQLKTNSNNRNINAQNCAKMYFEVDNTLFQNNNSNVDETINWMTSVFNNVQTLYNNDGIPVSLKSIFVWTTPDPYEGIGTTSEEYLNQFHIIRQNFDGDVGQLVSRDPGGMGGLADTVYGLCSSQNYSYSDLNFSYLSVPTYSWTVQLITHELGHLLGSRHTHACVWNGNDTSIDGCGQQMGYHEGDCGVGPIPTPTEKGTIMSYCYLISGVGIGFNNGFGAQPSASILDYMNSSSCLGSDCINSCSNTISSLNVDSVSTTSATISWIDDSGSFDSWKVSVTPYGETNYQWETVSSTSYIANDLQPNSYYVFRVKPNCISENGFEASFSKIIFVTADHFCNGVEIYDAGGPNNNYGDVQTVIRTIIPDSSENSITLDFIEFNFENNYDFFYLYDGHSTASPLIGTFTGTNLPESFVSNALDGSLTIKYTSDQSYNYSGFVAKVSCTSNLNLKDNNYVDFSYFPNPTNGKVFIASKISINKVFIYNTMGQLLYESSVNNLNTNVDISSFSSGTYFFKLSFDGNKSSNFKVLRN